MSTVCSDVSYFHGQLLFDEIGPMTMTAFFERIQEKKFIVNVYDVNCRLAQKGFMPQVDMLLGQRWSCP